MDSKITADYCLYHLQSSPIDPADRYKMALFDGAPRLGDIIAKIDIDALITQLRDLGIDVNPLFSEKHVEYWDDPNHSVKKSIPFLASWGEGNYLTYKDFAARMVIFGYTLRAYKDNSPSAESLEITIIEEREGDNVEFQHKLKCHIEYNGQDPCRRLLDDIANSMRGSVDSSLQLPDRTNGE